ncbi:unnamed protein product [Heligmosomoides polygyrus]|uniref:Uncharacterized protein n=1 Tax=Heligmosomoides polygyrus TaxID=6339 RepID=A0A183GA44_HELPZ|nr:unnamed protein product [Heligmosomoides polygyrus]
MNTHGRRRTSGSRRRAGWRLCAGESNRRNGQCLSSKRTTSPCVHPIDENVFRYPIEACRLRAASQSGRRLFTSSRGSSLTTTTATMKKKKKKRKKKNDGDDDSAAGE